ncbi:MAG: hypothetical protein KIT84_06965 [Labilithrix sp.]|nr:hypothetical protein [Labilithrix sp.]MCW5810735.1 hypothetical protein [Labilithrix sp.]
MKRAKQRTGGREKDIETDFWAKPTQPEKSWEEQVEGKEDESFVPYRLADKYTKGQLLLHTKFGKGVVVDADTSRVEILFQEGKKKLGHGQAS